MRRIIEYNWFIFYDLRLITPDGCVQRKKQLSERLVIL